MNTVLSLCHFCELHGPRIVFNTQGFKNVTSLEKVIDIKENELRNAVSTDEKESCSKWKYGVIGNENLEKASSIHPSESCGACKTFSHNKDGIISNDDENEVSYVSSQYPLQIELLGLIKQACIRSLSCEVCPEREGPIYFGDDTRGHVISYTFFLKDVQARGFQRWYSILVVMRDKMFLLTLWPYFTRYIREIIQKLQDSSLKVYSSEEGEANHKQNMKNITYDAVRRTRVTNPPRPLCKLVDDDKIWINMHTRLTWILKAAGMKMKERMRKYKQFPFQPDQKGEIALCRVYSLMGNMNFSKVIHYLYVGRKVVLKAISYEDIEQFLYFIKLIVPPFLYAHIHLNDNKMTKVENANIISMLHPITFDSRDKKVIIVTFSHSYEDDVSTPDMQQSASDLTIKVFEPFILQSRPPQLVSKMCTLFSCKSITPSVLDLYVAMLLDEWTNKVKLWLMLKKSNLQINSAASTPSFSSLYRSVTNSYYYTGKNLITTAMTHSACQMAIGTLDSDIPLLEVWAKNINSPTLSC